MKSAKKATALAVITMAILLFWVIPELNMGDQTRYARYYEDTETSETSTPKVTYAVHYDVTDTTQKRFRKLLTREVIEPRRTKKVSAWMFSRAMQFEPLTEGDSVLNVAKSDSLAIVVK